MGSFDYQFSVSEQEKLSPFVTNVDQSVFVLQNLPEVIKGALFSRYSRSKLGLRELLLKEFILSDDSLFNKIVVQGDRGGEDQELAVKKAQNFYDRILDGYGDDSIGELGGAHLALENVSMVATKILEDARIGGSPLEKSTRYIYFDEQVDGQFKYYREPKILASKYAKLYEDTCDHLFQTYSDLIPLVKASIVEDFPQDEKMSKAAYQASLRAKVCDSLRGLLPASTLTNMGVFGNGRFFEGLIRRMQVSQLKELNDLGQGSFHELSKVIPSFVRRAELKHEHNVAGLEFLRKQKDELQRVSLPFKWDEVFLGEAPQEVALVDSTHRAEAKVAAGLLFPHTDISFGELYLRMLSASEEEIKEVLETSYAYRENRRHKPPRGTELCEFTFDLKADFGMYRDLHRHRILSQERQLINACLGYTVPDDIKKAGVEDRFVEAMKKAREAFLEISAEFPEEAQYVVPMAYHVRWFVNINLRSLMWMTELRSSPQGHDAYRCMAQEMAKAVMEKHPMLEPFFKFVDFNNYELGRLDQETKKEQKKKELLND